ncbi:Crp/Fnr family transcriptional regulator [Echinicola sp. 20G]|uniref:Crp/Fnr family transcriptional regulator n=1 Tax=Echinicola sp. 20G TaxID=2781961 RepID=UPI001910FAAF|nr:Crp/Fnr family transcriptional regulator [Echinicola sp. 20G]
MHTLQQYIKTYFDLKANDLETLASLFISEKLSKGEYYLKTGSYDSKLSFIKTGHLRIFDYINAKDITQWISSPGDFVTDLQCLIFQGPARKNIQAISDCELFTITKTNYQRLPDIIPKWHEIEKIFIAKCFMTLEDRVFGFLSLSAEERFQHLFDYNRELFNQVPLHQIASMLGMSPETLSRIRKNLNS